MVEVRGRSRNSNGKEEEKEDKGGEKIIRVTVNIENIKGKLRMLREK